MKIVIIYIQFRLNYCKLNILKLIDPFCLNAGSGRTILFFSIFQFGVLVALAWTVRFCYIFWSKRKLKEQDLQMFLETRVDNIVLHSMSNIKFVGTAIFVSMNNSKYHFHIFLSYIS